MLNRAAPRSLRSLHLLQQSTPFRTSLRTYAKAGKPRPPIKPPAHSASSIIDTKNVRTPFKTPTQTEPSTAAASSDAHAIRQKPVKQEKLDEEAIDALPTTEESTSKSGIGAQAESSRKEPSIPNEEPSVDEFSGTAQRPAEQQIPLHDLTKGIPSTLQAELKQAAKKQDEAAAEEQGEASSGSGGSRERPVRDYTTSAERRRNKAIYWFMASLGVAILSTPIYLGRNWETEEQARLHPNAPNGWGVGLFADRVRARLTSNLAYYSEPAFEKLLPDQDPLMERPYTLVIGLEDLLMHSEWTREHGWRMAKRPGVDYFLKYLSQYYEIVIFTSVPAMIGQPALMKLDPLWLVPMRLFREATRYDNGAHIKDLSYLNRPLNKVVSIDTDPSHTQAQAENAIIIPRWTGDPNDKELIALIPFLEYTAAMGLDDTRKVIASFQGKHIPTEFALREAETRKRFNEQNSIQRRSGRRFNMGSLGSSLGIRADQGLMQLPPGEMSVTEGLERGMMLHDIIRQRGQKNYEAMEKEINENKEDWLRMQKEDEEKQRQEQMQGLKKGIFGWWRGDGEEKEDIKNEKK